MTDPTTSPESPAPPRRRRGRTVALLAGAAVLLAACGTGGWWWLRKDDPPECTALLEDREVRRALGVDRTDGLDCAGVARKVRQVTTGGTADRHTPRQADALGAVVTAVSGGLPDGEDPRLAVDPALRVPLAGALAEYPADTRRILGGTAQGPAAEAGGHLAVPARDLVRVLRAVSDSPRAFADLHRAAVTGARSAMEAAPQDAGPDAVRGTAREGARVLGTLDAVHEDIVRGEGDGGAEQERAADRKVSAWAVDPQHRMTTHVERWAASRHVNPRTDPVHNLLRDVRNDQSAAEGEAEKTLDGRN